MRDNFLLDYSNDMNGGNGLVISIDTAVPSASFVEGNTISNYWFSFSGSLSNFLLYGKGLKTGGWFKRGGLIVKVATILLSSLHLGLSGS